jgi:redox-sensitive bicupin YhaK (pirin superfamily)
MIEFSDGKDLHISTGRASHARFVLIAGSPFGEPIVPYGPFVMNTEEEIRQVFLDIQKGTFAQNSMI